MAQTWRFQPQQVTLQANVAFAVTPVVPARRCEVINTTAGDLAVRTVPTDVTTGFSLLAGYSKVLDTDQRGFDPNFVAFYLLSVGGGTVVLIWF